MVGGSAIGVGALVYYGAPDYWPLLGLMTGFGAATYGSALTGCNRSEYYFVSAVTLVALAVGYYATQPAHDAAAVSLSLFAPTATILAALLVAVRRGLLSARERDAA